MALPRERAYIEVRPARFRYAEAMGRHRFCVYTKIGEKWEFIGTIWRDKPGDWKGQARIGGGGWNVEGRSRTEISERLKEMWQGVTDKNTLDKPPNP